MSNVITKRQINVSMPEDTLVMLNRALSNYLDGQREVLHSQLREGYRKNAKEDKRMAKEWYPLEQEVWAKLD